jgi:hypothetical protein
MPILSVGAGVDAAALRAAEGDATGSEVVAGAEIEGEVDAGEAHATRRSAMAKGTQRKARIR